MRGGSSQSSSRPAWARGLCDRCGFPYRLNELHEEYYDERPNGLLVCSTCRDIDNPQLQLGRISAGMFDPQSLIDPRPDTGVPGSTGLFGWAPIGNPLNSVSCQVGNITVVIT